MTEEKVNEQDLEQPGTGDAGAAGESTGDAGAAGDATADAEARARSLGWVPKEEFRGDPDTWRSAEEFIKHGEETLPILRENIKKLHTKLDEQGRVIKNFAEHHKKTEERAYNQALKKLQEERRDAVDKGDTARFEEIDGEIKELEETKASDPAGDKGDKKAGQPGFAEWKNDNSWYDDDIEMSMYADQVGSYFASHNPDLPPGEIFSIVTKEVKAKFPHRFKNPRRGNPSTVETGSPAPGEGGGKGRSYADLPPEAKATCNDFVKQGLLTKEQYVKDYFAEE